LVTRPIERCLRQASLAEDAVNSRQHFGAVRERHGASVELFQVAKAEVHG
jgi:hypothetical protein